MLRFLKAAQSDVKVFFFSLLLSHHIFVFFYFSYCHLFHSLNILHSTWLSCVWWNMKPWILNHLCSVHLPSMSLDAHYKLLQPGHHCFVVTRAMTCSRSGTTVQVASTSQLLVLSRGRWILNTVRNHCRDCSNMILRFHRAASTAQLNVTYEKYLKPDLSCVAAIEPLDQLPKWWLPFFRPCHL